MSTWNAPLEFNPEWYNQLINSLHEIDPAAKFVAIKYLQSFH